MLPCWRGLNENWVTETGPPKHHLRQPGWKPRKNSSMELMVIWGNSDFSFSDFGCFDFGHFFLSKILTETETTVHILLEHPAYRWFDFDCFNFGHFFQKLPNLATSSNHLKSSSISKIYGFKFHLAGFFCSIWIERNVWGREMLVWIFRFIGSKSWNMEDLKIWNLFIRFGLYLTKYKYFVKEVQEWNAVLLNISRLRITLRNAGMKLSKKVWNSLPSVLFL